MRGFTTAILFVAPALLAASPAGPREAFGNAHLLLMVRTQVRGQEARLADLEIWAEGTRLRAQVRDSKAELWVDGLGTRPLYLADGKVAEPRKHSIESALKVALAASASAANANSDRIAGHPCKIITETPARDAALTRCMWHGLPLSVELSQGNFTFNAAATLVEEGVVTVADLQPPAGAPPASPSMSAGN